MNESRKFGASTALAIVVANMIGTGVFTSLGFQLLDIQSGFVLLMLWIIGGVVALCGALSYAELGASFPRSGGEYHFLSQTIHPGVGFISGWVSATIGFAAPTALVAITFGQYLSALWPTVSATGLAIGLILLLAGVHSINHRSSSGVQSSFTLIKVVLIVLYCTLALISVAEFELINFRPQTGDVGLMLSGAFAVSLIYVSYAYTGWNAATYLSSEVRSPQRALPWVLTAGTLLVTVLYLMLNATFLLTAPIDALSGRVEIGFIAAESAFGPIGGKLMGGMLAVLLVSTVSAMLLAGPRVLQAIGRDFTAFESLYKTNRSGIPVRAILLQATLAVGFVLTGTFQSILIFAGFTLALNTFATVVGLLWIRYRKPELRRPFRSPLFPLPPVIYLSVTGWTLWFVVREQPGEAFAGLAIVLGGWLFYLLSRNSQRRPLTLPGRSLQDDRQEMSDQMDP